MTENIYWGHSACSRDDGCELGDWKDDAFRGAAQAGQQILERRYLEEKTDWRRVAGVVTDEHTRIVFDVMQTRLTSKGVVQNEEEISKIPP